MKTQRPLAALDRPFRARILVGFQNPGRCPDPYTELLAPIPQGAEGSGKFFANSNLTAVLLRTASHGGGTAGPQNYYGGGYH